MTPGEFEVFVVDEMARIYRVARRYTSSSADAEDLVAATLASGFQDLSRFDGRFPMAWILRIMRNVFLKTKRGGAEPVKGDLDRGLVDESAHRAFMDRIHQIDILAALDKLPEDYRLAIVLCDMEDLDYVEASIALGIPIGTVRSRLSRGRKQLQSLLGTWAMNQ